MTKMSQGRRSHWRCSVRPVALRIFAKFTGKHQYLGLFLGLKLY